MTKTQQFLERVDEVARFCLGRRGKCFAGWSKEKIFVYVGFHALCGTLFIARDSSKNIRSVAFAWPTAIQRIHDVFSWRSTPPGKALFIAEVIGRRRDAANLFFRALNKWPFVSRFFTYRRDRLVELPRPTLLRFAYE